MDKKVYVKKYYFGFQNWHGQINPYAWNADEIAVQCEAGAKVEITESEFNEPLSVLARRYEHLRSKASSS